MRKSVLFVLIMVLILPAMMFTMSCAKKDVATKPSVSAPPEKPAAMVDTSAADAERARRDAERMKAEELERARKAAMGKFVNEDILFDFDSSAITPAAQQILSQKADFMSKNSGVRVTIEGHCDDRGTDAYNMALGERRAEAAKAFLVNLGIAANRLNTISYGEEKPIDPGQNEAAWAKNRRAHFGIN